MSLAGGGEIHRCGLPKKEQLIVCRFKRLAEWSSPSAYGRTTGPMNLLYFYS